MTAMLPMRPAEAYPADHSAKSLSSDVQAVSAATLVKLIDSRPVLASDWKKVSGKAQSGLPYAWTDGTPHVPAATWSRRMQLLVKRAIDVAGAGVGLVVLAPFLIAVAGVIKMTSPGPVFFRQQRVGVNGRPFKIFKFRTMFVDTCDYSGVAQTVEADSRVTPLGKFMRAKSIDELPQLINVLFGDMSLVGPRPHVHGMLAAGVAYESLVPYYPLRYAMKPGITGWAQANGFRGPTSDAEHAYARVDHDIAYIQNFSLWLDARTLVITIWRELTRGTGV